MRRIGLGVIAAAVMLAACNSPEATRMRAGGPGADTGNRSRIVEMHEGSQPYWKTPVRLSKDVGMADDGTATQAHRMSRSEASASP